jgi:beta-lactamase regulating signal transducer with metallopeptidase domain
MGESVERFAFDLTGFLLVKATLLLSFVWIVCRLLHRASAPTRHTLWAIAFTSLVVMPVLPYIVSAGVLAALPKFTLPVLPAGLMVKDLGGAVQAVAGDAGSAPFVPLFVIGLVIWVAGALYLLGRLAADLLRVRAMTAASSAAPGHLGALAERLRGEAGIRRPVRVLVSGQTRVPLTWGYRRPVILLPVTSPGWPAGRSEAVLRHELAHVRRSDFLGLMLVELIRSLYWVNPLSAAAARRSRLEQELSCDDAAIRSGISPAAYARHLLDVAREAAAPVTVARAVLTMARPSTLKTRVRSSLRADDASVVRRARVGLAALAVVVAGAIGAAGIDPWDCDPEPVPIEITDATRIPA